MRKLTLVIAGLVATSFAAAAIAPAYVNMEKIFQDYYKTALADEYLRQQTDEYREYALSLAKEIQDNKKEFEKLLEESQNIVYTEELREENRMKAQLKLRDLEAKKKQLRNYETHRKDELSKQYEKKREKIIEKISEQISAIAKRNNYDMVLDVSGKTLNGIPPFGHEDEIKRLKEKAEARDNE
jgi:Skp family chaperone for outer membrane proteins